MTKKIRHPLDVSPVIALLNAKGENGIRHIEDLLTARGYKTQRYFIKKYEDIEFPAEQNHAITFFPESIDLRLIQKYTLWRSYLSPKITIGICALLNFESAHKLLKRAGVGGANASEIVTYPDDEKRFDRVLSESYRLVLEEALPDIGDYKCQGGFFYKVNTQEEPDFHLYCTRHNVLETSGLNNAIIVDGYKSGQTYFQSINHGLIWANPEEVVVALKNAYNALDWCKMNLSWAERNNLFEDGKNNGLVHLVESNTICWLTIKIGSSQLKEGFSDRMLTLANQLEIQYNK